MRYEDAVMQAIEELSKVSPEFNSFCLALMIRAGQLCTDTKKCEVCGGGG